jgi:protein pelota
MSIISCFLSFLQALIFSSMHVSGQQLTQLSGIAALLRFPLPDLEDQELDDAI